MNRDEIAAIGGWNTQVLDQQYATLLTGDSLAKVSGFADQASYCVPRLLLDPVCMPEFAPLVEAVFPGLPDELRLMQHVSAVPQLDGLLQITACMHPLWCPLLMRPPKDPMCAA